MTLPRAPFGRSGHESTRLIFGAAALGSMSQDRADVTLATVDAAGINHIDTAAGYGASEDRLQPFLATNRDRFYLATKTGEREGDKARAQLERSLERMGVDHVDLIQLHNLVEPDEWEIAFARGGALEAMVRARDEGLAGAGGVTRPRGRIPFLAFRGVGGVGFGSLVFPLKHSLIGEDPDCRDARTPPRGGAGP